MLFPLHTEELIGHWGMNALYIVVGFFFGFVLERAGFGNSRVLAAQFYLRNMRVLKVMFTAIVTAMLLVFWSSALGLLDISALFIQPTHLWPGIVGGLIFGAGFVIGGYCPGTAIVSASTLKLDGLFFVLGLAGGMFVFGETLPSFQAFFEKSGDLGDLTLGDVFGLGSGLLVLLVVLMALGMFVGAEWCERLFRRIDGRSPAPESAGPDAVSNHEKES
jgi:uncharacterized membrane protein YedE/YeeE